MSIPDQPDPPDQHGQQGVGETSAAVIARGIALTGPWGPVFGPLDLDVAVGGVTVLIGPAGQGRTALLMSLAGRMNPSAGSITVLGYRRARDIFTTSALACVEQLDPVSESVTVRDLITEKLRWDAPWYRLIGQAGDAEHERVCRPVFGDLPLPYLMEYVEHLSELDGMLLRIALANTTRPPLLVVGNVDQVSSDLSREALIRRLVELGQHQTIITASVNELPPELGVRQQIPVEHLDRVELVGRHRSHGKKGDD